MQRQSKMNDKIVLITGGTGGIGKQTALELARLGAHVVVTGRSQASGEAAVSELQELSGSPAINLLLADLSTQAGVRSLAKAFTQAHSHLDVLINNAGLASSERRITEDGVEAGFAVNAIAPVLLTQLLMDRLKSSASARVITVTGGRHPDTIELDNLQAERSFEGLNSYSHSKLIMMALMIEFSQRVEGTNVTLNVCYPGNATTSMTQNVTPKMLPGIMRLFWPLFKLMTRPDSGQSAAKAARSSIYLASSPDVGGINGTYFDTASEKVDWPEAGLNPATRRHLWGLVEQLTAS
jgi:NAD(P)-dependent dehydrogenase (short-subunit alcohol dehydrogenase family)